MATKKKASKRSGTYSLGRIGFAKISEVEGIRPSHRLEADFREFDRLGLSAAERRRVLVKKYGREA